MDLIKSKCRPVSWPQDAAQRLADFLEDVHESITELQKATPKTLKEENKKLVNHLKTRKRRLLADVLKKIRAMGFQHNLSQDILDSQSSLSRALHKLGALELDKERPAQQTSQSHLHKMLGLMASVREGSRKHSEDLTPAEAARCAVYLESVLSMSTAQQNNLCQYSLSSRNLRHSISAFEAFADSIEPRSSSSVQAEFSLQQLRCMPTMFETCARLIRLQSQLASRDYQTVIDGLSQITTDVQSFVNRIDRAHALPTGIVTAEDLTAWQSTASACEHTSSSISAWIEQYPELEPTLAQMTKWLPSPDHVRQSSITGAMATSTDDWTSQVLDLIDKLLVSVQNLEKALPTTQPDDNEAAWLIRDEHQLESAWGALQVDKAASHTDALLCKLQDAANHDDSALSALSTVCKSVFPLLHAYSTVSEQVLSAYTDLHLRLNQMDHVLGTSFVTLAKDGFCSPPEKSEDSKQDSGDVEAGTGLGDGEGGEDISKDIGNEEDLSELAQENKGKDREEEIEDEQDAVDMADQEMEGDLGDAETGSQNEEEGDDQSDGDEMEEESGKVGDLDDGAVDEKMWDDGKQEEKEDEKEKETDSGKGTAQDQEMSAANEGEKEEGEDGEAGEDGDMEEEEQATGPDEEDVSKKDTEAADPHMQEQENLDLPDDLNMDGDKDDKDDVSEGGSMEPDDMPPDTGAEDEPAGDADKEENQPDEAAQPDSEDKEAEDDAMQTQEAGEETEPQDDPEVSDDEGVEDENLLQNKDTDLDDAPDEGTTEDEQGASKDEDEPQAQAAGGANADDNDTEPNEDAQAKQDSGTQSGANETEAEQPSEKSEQSAAAQRQSNYKQIGDVLEEWYKQQREIEAPTESADAENQQQQQQQDMDMANATFEHLPDADAEADTQALGTASADQSGALNEETSKAVNEDKEMEDAPFQELPEDKEEEGQGEQGEQDPQMEPSDQLPQDSDFKAFVGEQNKAQDIEMGEDAPPKETDSEDDEDVEEMDDQLLRTHISREDGPEEMTIEDARQTWASHEASTRNLSLILTEHLRLILQPTQATKMRGDFRTGKRLNIKRIIPYIASSYKRDKIWMRRSIPSKRNYQIMLAIDDSKSMDESDSKSLAFETLALVAKSMAMLEVGELCVLGFGENVKVAHDFSSPFTSEAGAEVFKSFSFAQTTTNVHKLLKESIELFRSARLKAVGSSSELWQLQLIISDGVCENHPSIRQLVREAHEERIMIVFVVVDSAAQRTDSSSGNAQGKGQSIVDLQRAEFVKDADGNPQLNMIKYLDTFPFRYYLIVRDVQELPGVLAGALRQWFSEVVESGA